MFAKRCLRPAGSVRRGRAQAMRGRPRRSERCLRCCGATAGVAAAAGAATLRPRQLQPRHHLRGVLLIQLRARGLARHGRAQQLRLEALAADARQLLQRRRHVHGAADQRRAGRRRHRAIERALDPAGVGWQEAGRRHLAGGAVVLPSSQVAAPAVTLAMPRAITHLKRTRGRRLRWLARSGGQDCTWSLKRAAGRGGATGDPPPAAPSSMLLLLCLRCTAGGAAGWAPHMGVAPGGSLAGAANGSKLWLPPSRAGEPVCCRREGHDTGGGHAVVLAGVRRTSTVSSGNLAVCGSSRAVPANVRQGRVADGSGATAAAGQHPAAAAVAVQLRRRLLLARGDSCPHRAPTARWLEHQAAAWGGCSAPGCRGPAPAVVTCCSTCCRLVPLVLLLQVHGGRVRLHQPKRAS